MEAKRFSVTISGDIILANSSDAPSILEQCGLRLIPGAYDGDRGVVVDNVRITCDGNLQEELKLAPEED